MTKITNNRNESDITIDHKDIKMHNKGVLWKLYANKFDNRDEISKYFGKHKLSNLKKKIENFNGPLIK